MLGDTTQPITETKDEPLWRGRSEAAWSVGSRSIRQLGGEQRSCEVWTPHQAEPPSRRRCLVWLKSMMHEWLEMAVEGGGDHTPKARPRSLGFSWGDGESGKGSGRESTGCGKGLPGALWTLAGGRGQGPGRGGGFGDARRDGM